MKFKSILSFILMPTSLMCTAACGRNNTTASTTAEKAKTVNLKIGSYNIKHGNLVSLNFDLIADDIIDNGIEIVALQEVDCNTGRNKKQDTMKILSERTNYYFAYGSSFDYDGGQYGNGILSKYPILNYEVIKLPKATCAEEQRTLIHAEIDVDGQIFNFFATHLQWDNATALQLAEINKHTKDLENFVVGGDFNSEAFELFTVVENSYIANTGHVTEPTGMMIDNFITSNNIISQNFDVINTGNSDHYLITSEISIPFTTN